jgi:O-antigen ligase
MIAEIHPTCRGGRLQMAFWLLGVLSLLLFAYATFKMEIEPFWVLLAIPVALLLAILVRKFPVFLMVAMVYVGVLKTRGAVGISVTDPTLVTAALLYAAMILQGLLLAIGVGGGKLHDLFAGQMVGFTAFCLLILVIAISYSYTPAPDIGRDKVLKLVAFDAPLFLAPLIFLRTDRTVRQLVLLSMLGSLILACRTLYRVTHPTAELLLGKQDPTEIGEGLLMGATALMALYYPFREKPLFRVALIGLIIVLVCGTTASLSRSAILSLLLVAAASLLLLRRKLPISPKTILMIVATVIITVCVASAWLWHLPATHSKLALKASEFSLTLNGKYPPGGTAGERYSFSESAWQAFLARPLLGWGAGGWSTLWHLDDERVVRYPHDFVLEIAAEQGLAGLAALSLLLLAMVRASMKIVTDPAGRFVFIVPVVALTLLGNAVTGQVDDRGMWFVCGTLFAVARIVEQKPFYQPRQRFGINNNNLDFVGPDGSMEHPR